MFINTINNTIKHAKTIIRELESKQKLPFADIISAKTDFEKSNCRDRIFTPELTIHGFLSQAINADKSCQSAVSQISAYMARNGREFPSANTAAYCQARSRLPMEVLPSLAREVALNLEKQTPKEWLWRNRHIKIPDGTTLSMPDTHANQAVYPQLKSQKKGVGFPIMRVVGIFSLATGALIDCAMSPYAGKGAGEQTLIRQLLDNFNEGDIFLADACYHSYFLIAALINKRVDIVFPKKPSRKTNFGNGERLGSEDHLIELAKPQKPEWMDSFDYDAFPSTITIRETKVSFHRAGFRDKSKILVTTLTCNKTITPQDLNELYSYRWFVEIDLNSIKEIMSMGILRCKTPEMVYKEIWAHLLAYNLIRKIMAQSASINNSRPRQMSFKLALQMLCALSQAGILCDEQIYTSFLENIAYKKVGNRPGRFEPRRVKRRPKRHKLLIWPRNYYKNEVAVYANSLS